MGQEVGSLMGVILVRDLLMGFILRDRRRWGRKIQRFELLGCALFNCP